MSWTCCRTSGVRPLMEVLNCTWAMAALPSSDTKRIPCGRLQLAFAEPQLGGAASSSLVPASSFAWPSARAAFCCPSCASIAAAGTPAAVICCSAASSCALPAASSAAAWSSRALPAAACCSPSAMVGGCLVELGLRRERIHCALDVGKGLELGQRGRYGVLAGLAETGHRGPRRQWWPSRRRRRGAPA